MTGVPGAGTHSINVPPPNDGDPEALRHAAWRFETSAHDVDAVVASVRHTAAEVMGTAQWRGAAADAFQQRAVEPICETLSSVAQALEDAASALKRGANALEEALSQRRQAEGMAIAGGVAVALTLFTFGVSDVAAAEAAAGAAALMARAAAAAAGAMRAVMLAMEDAAAAIRALSVTMRAWGTELGYAASMTLPRLVLSPVGAGAMSAAGTAALGDREPSDLIQAFALSYLEGKSGELGESDRGLGVAEQSAILRAASRGKGNFGLGSTTVADADVLGQAWVGPGYRVSGDGRAWLSADRMRQYRPPRPKSRLGRSQANFEQRWRPEGQWQSNGHLDIEDQR
jgi:WXG100 family type VII secretion target